MTYYKLWMGFWFVCGELEFVDGDVCVLVFGLFASFAKPVEEGNVT